jgi:YD repeat-containing protein
VTNALFYDADGNLTNDGAMAYTWDAENRLVAVISNSAVIVSNAYDYMGRRVAKAVNGVTNRFLYDGWALISEISHQASPLSTNVYVYGLDLSGSLQGAGAIGGLLWASLTGTNVFYGYDGNGNVTDLIDVNGDLVGHYAYDPYGQLTAG